MSSTNAPTGRELARAVAAAARTAARTRTRLAADRERTAVAEELAARQQTCADWHRRYEITPMTDPDTAESKPAPPEPGNDQD